MATTAADTRDQGTPPGTGAEARDPNVYGRATAITVFSRVNRAGEAWLPLLFGATTRIPELTSTVARLSFIHFARWSLVDEFPYLGPPQVRERLRHRYLFFESNFNGTWGQYIDAFSHILTRGMTAIWGTSYGFPKPLPVGPFKRYIRRNEFPASHYWSAYPTVTRTMACQALELRPAHEALARRAPDMSPERFAAAWREFVTEQQRRL